MSKMKKAIKKLINSSAEVKIYIPGKSFRICKIVSLDDDVVEVQTQLGRTQETFKMHYSLFIVEI